MDDYYKLLGVEKSAGSQDLKKSYRKLARRFHPDLHPEIKDGGEQFKKISEAYRILSDPESRALYDRYGPRGVKNRLREMDISSHRQFYERFFSKATRLSSLYQTLHNYDREERRGYDIRRELAASLWSEKRGGRAELRVMRRRYCARCRGEKRVAGKRCPECHGTGRKAYPETVRVRIPAGARAGETLRVPGKGHDGFKGGSPGDLYLTLR